MLLGVTMHIANNVGLRATAKSLRAVMEWWWRKAREVGDATIRNWSSCQLAAYAPQGMRKKARFHQILTVHKWGMAILRNWDALPEAGKLELCYVKENAGLMGTLGAALRARRALLRLGQGNGRDRLDGSRMRPFLPLQIPRRRGGAAPKVSALHQAMVRYVREVRATMPHLDQRFAAPTSSRVFFGKYKNKGGCTFITDDALEIAAYPFDIQYEDVRKAGSAS